MLWRRSDPYAVALVEECEAFLSGTYVELCEARGEPVPVWAWMNLLAHGTEDQLRHAMTQHPSAGLWRHARGFVVGELLDRVDAQHRSLPEFQAGVLVPLELEVLACADAKRWQPGQLVARLLDALPERRDRQRR
jgi:hypothetical protein